MSTKPNYFNIGLFALTAIIFGVAGIITLGSGGLFKSKIVMETYINESVQGLDIGSPIKLRGVKIGQVETITFVNEVYPSKLRLILIRATISARSSNGLELKYFCENLQKEIHAGLRVRLAAQGITGTAYLEADYMDPKQCPPLNLDFTPACLYVPSSSSMIGQISDSIVSVLQKIDKMEVDKLAHDIDTLIVRMNGFLENDLASTLGEIRGLSAEMNRNFTNLSASLNQLVDHDLTAMVASLNASVTNDVRPFLQNARLASESMLQTLGRIDTTVESVNGLVESEQDRITETLENLRVTTRNFRDISESLQEQPSGILLGRPPPPVEVYSK